MVSYENRNKITNISLAAAIGVITYASLISWPETPKGTGQVLERKVQIDKKLSSLGDKLLQCKTGCYKLQKQYDSLEEKREKILDEDETTFRKIIVGATLGINAIAFTYFIKGLKISYGRKEE